MDALKRKNDALERQKKFAWASFYKKVEEQLDAYSTIIQQAETLQQNQDIPKHLLNDYFDMAEKLRKKIECPVCYDVVNKGNFSVPLCGHIFCRTCIEYYKSHNENPKCPICKKLI